MIKPPAPMTGGKNIPADAVLTKERLLEIITALLETNADLGFLMKIDQTELETLVACVRDRLDRNHK